MDNLDNDKSKKPLRVFRTGGISVAIFENTSEDGNVFHKLSAERVYQSGGKFKTTNSFSFNELPTLVMLLKRAWYYVLELESVAKDKKQD
jgi:hypothetical protein